MTGVDFEFDQGAIRELHWHPNADEWQYVVEGTFRVALFGAKGRFRQETISAGDVAYIPQGYGHSVENVGDGVGKILIGLKAGIFQAIDLSEWIAGQPDDVLATNLAMRDEQVRALPRRDFFINDGAPPG